VSNLGSKKGAKRQLCCSWPEIPAQTKENEWEHCRGGETYLQCTILGVISITLLPIDVTNSQIVMCLFSWKSSLICAMFSPILLFQGNCECSASLRMLLDFWTWRPNQIFEFCSLFHLWKVKGKVVPVLNKAPRHEDVLGEWKYSSTHSWPRQ
jgi:hypothetical protein